MLACSAGAKTVIPPVLAGIPDMPKPGPQSYLGVFGLITKEVALALDSIGVPIGAIIIFRADGYSVLIHSWHILFRRTSFLIPLQH